MKNNRIMVYPNDIELRFIKKEANEKFRNNMAGYIMSLVVEKMQEQKNGK